MLSHVLIIIFAMIYIALDGGWILNKATNESLISKLFRWKSQVEYNGVSFYLRVVSDATVEDARKHALIDSRKMRRSLRDTETDNYLIYLDAYSDYTKEDLVAFIQIAASKDVMREYLANNARPALEPLPDSPTQEQLENYEEAREQQSEQYVKDMQAAVEVWRVEFEKGLEQQTEDKLLLMARKLRIDEVCEGVFNASFETYIVASSVYVDDKYTRRFFTIEEYNDLPTEVKQVLYDGYNNMNTAADDVKN